MNHSQAGISLQQISWSLLRQLIVSWRPRRLQSAAVGPNDGDGDGGDDHQLIHLMLVPATGFAVPPAFVSLVLAAGFMLLAAVAAELLVLATG